MVMVGDNCQTDIALGNNAGISSCLVMTGVVKDENQAYQLASQNEDFRPSYFLESFGAKI
jgi:ribonucleotide monophosphatase NagD (HAD superfamily)